MSGIGLPSEVQPRPRDGPLSGARQMDQRPYPFGVFPQMSLKPEDIMRAAISLVDEFGEQAETAVDVRIASCMQACLDVTAGRWREIRDAIGEIRAHEATEIGSVGHACSHEP